MCIFDSTKNEFRTNKAFQKNDIIIIIININCCYIILLFITITLLLSLLFYYYYIHFFINLCMRYIVTAESKSLFNYGNRTEKIFWPTQPRTFRAAGNQKNPDWDI